MEIREQREGGNGKNQKGRDGFDDGWNCCLLEAIVS